MKLLIPEILVKVNEAKTKEEKIALLRKHDSQPLRGMLYLAFVPVAWKLPEGDPPYKKNSTPLGLSESTLYREARKMYIWVGNQPSTLTRIKREQLFIELLESVHSTEAQLLLDLKNQNFKKTYKKVTEDIVREAFPGLLPPPVKKEEQKKVPLEQKS